MPAAEGVLLEANRRTRTVEIADLYQARTYSNSIIVDSSMVLCGSGCSLLEETTQFVVMPALEQSTCIFR